MKKTLLLAGVATTLLTFNANAIELKPYIGLDYNYTDASYADDEEESLLENKFNSFSLAVGTKFNENFGIEAFYQKSDEQKSQPLQNIITGEEGYIKTSFYSYGLDAIGYLPVAEKINVLGSLGVGQYEYEVKGLGIKESGDTLGYRLGLGAQYDITDNWAVRGMARYVIMNDDEDIDDMTEFSIGARYTF